MEEMYEDSVKFIETHLIPEMVHNRCFCPVGSREFVEFVAVSVKCLDNVSVNDDRELYSAKVTINFSGEPHIFQVIIKLLSLHAQDNSNCAYDRFLNEEMFYNKMTAKYQLNLYPKCYVADMGRYGRPVVVLEDLRATGFQPVTLQLNRKQREICFKAIDRFIARGIEIKCNEFEIFREFYSKLMDINAEGKRYIELINEKLKLIRQQSSNHITTEMKTILDRIPQTILQDDQYFTICHGNLTLDNIMFRYENGVPIDVKILGWNQMSYTLPGIDLQHIIIDNLQEKIDTINVPPSIHKYDIELLYYYPYITSEEVERICMNFS